MQSWLQILFFAFCVKPFLWLIIGPNIVGKQHLPKSGPFLLIANHNSHLDIFLLLHLFPLQQLQHIHPVAAADYFLSNKILAWFTQTFINIVPIPRTGITRENNPLTRMGQIVEEGHAIILFPEGSRGKPEVAQPFQAGVAHLIEKHPNLPVLPVFIRGAGQALPKGEFLLIPFFCDVIIGPVMQPTGKRAEILAQLEQGVLELASFFEQ